VTWNLPGGELPRATGSAGKKSGIRPESWLWKNHVALARVDLIRRRNLKPPSLLLLAGRLPLWIEPRDRETLGGDAGMRDVSSMPMTEWNAREVWIR